ncbi:MAG: 50S ribosomal protein L3, partial [Caldiserica bacterium]|nr:50S ribosomal protein L3 [Caldisericota bacterium]
KYKVSPQRILREFPWKDIESVKEGDVVSVEIFEGYKFVDIEGNTKGKGFQGVVKRWGFSGGPASHGAKQWHRRPGSIGASSWPSRVFKGRKMPGRLGGKKVTVKNLEIVEVQKEKDLLLVKGAVPGFSGGYVFIKNPRK